MWFETLHSPLKCTVFLIYGNCSYLYCRKIFTEKFSARLTGGVSLCLERSQNHSKVGSQETTSSIICPRVRSAQSISIHYICLLNSPLKPPTICCTCTNSPDLFLKPPVMELLQGTCKNLCRASWSQLMKHYPQYLP